MTESKNLTIRVSPEVHKAIRVYVSSKGMSAQDYIFELIKNDMKKNGVKLDDK